MRLAEFCQAVDVLFQVVFPLVVELIDLQECLPILEEHLLPLQFAGVKAAGHLNFGYNTIQLLEVHIFASNN